MNKELQAIYDAWDFGSPTDKAGDNRDEDKTRRLADKYVEAHPEQFEVLAALGDNSEDAIIHALSLLRDEPDNPLQATLNSTYFRDTSEDVDSADRWFLLQVWLWHAFEPRNIGSAFTATVRIPPKRKE